MVLAKCATQATGRSVQLERVKRLEEADEDAAEGRAGSAPGKSVVHRAVGTLGGQYADEVEAHRADLTLTEGLEAAL